MLNQIFKSILLSSLLTFPVSIFYFNLTINIAQSRVGIAQQDNLTITPTLALGEKDKRIENIAQQITVKINSGDKKGSGIIIKKEGNLYTVLTNRHVISTNKPINLTTPDGKVITATQIKGLNLDSLDVVLLQFNSANNYTVAQFANANNLGENTPIYAAGFPYETDKFTFVSGTLIKSPDQAFKNGYQVGYDLNYEQEIAKGMSGGLILTEDGKVIGINGIHADAVTILYNPFVYQKGAKPTAAELDRYTRYNWGIFVSNIAKILPHYFSLQDTATTQQTALNREKTVYNEVKQQAQRVTVRLELLSEKTSGSGVIVGKNNNTYYVLTGAHVVEALSAPRNLEIITPDGKTHKANNQSVIIFKGADMALVEFTSDQQYELATIATKKPNEGKDNFTFVAGFPADTKEFTFTAGKIFDESRGSLIIGNSVHLGNGYDMVYTNITAAGMSGGPVLDFRGNLVGIHGRVEGENIINQATGKQETVFLGNSFGVLGSIFLGRLSETPVKKDWLKLNNAPLPELTREEAANIRATFPQPVKPTSNNPIDWLNYGNQLSRLEQSEEAILVFDKVIQLEPKSHLAWFAKGMNHYWLLQYKLALEAFNQVINLKPDLAMGYDLKGSVLFDLGKYQESVSTFDQALKLSQNIPEQQFTILIWRGWSLHQLKHYQEAVESYSKALNIKKNSWGYHSRGFSFYYLQKYPEAIADYTKAIELNPQFAYAYNNRGITYKKLQKYDEARKDFQQAANLYLEQGKQADYQDALNRLNELHK